MNYQIDELDEDTNNIILDEGNEPSINFLKSFFQWLIVMFLCISSIYIIIDSDTLTKNSPNVVDIQSISSIV